MAELKEVIEEVIKSGLSVVEHENNSGAGEVNHLSIIGGKRRVEYYPTTGTVYANKENNWPKYNLKSASIKVAIKLAKEGKF